VSGGQLVRLSERRRTRNITESERCRRCQDDGLFVVGAERRNLQGRLFDHDVCAPCPDCERGHRIEFPERGDGIWGRDGFWRGRSPEQLDLAGGGA
jgi:hypothetical protein